MSPPRRVVPRRRQTGVALVLGLLATACASGGATGGTAPQEATQPPSTTTTTSARPVERRPAAAAAPCPARPPPFRPGGARATACSLEADGVTVDVAVYPRPDYDADVWSAWSQGLVLPDGRYLSTIGDEGGTDGNSFLFEYDPATATLERVVDVAGAIEADDGYGKVHGQLVPAADGTVLLSTYWGDRDAVDPETYGGDHLLRYDPDARTLDDLGAPVPGFGVPSLAGSPDGRLLFGEAVDPAKRQDTGPFFVYDIARQEVVYRGSAEGHVGFRNVLVDADGVAHFSIGDGRLAAYDPGTGDVTVDDGRLPGAWLRASTRPAADGTVYGTTREPDRLFARRADGTIEPIGGPIDYTTSLAMSPDGRRVYYVPGAHGRAWRNGTPLLALDTATGESSEVVALNDLIEPALGLRVGGTYSVAVGPAGDTVYVTLNAGDPGERAAFGEVVLAAVNL